MLDVNSKYNLDNLDPKWDNKKIEYDLLRYDWPTKLLDFLSRENTGIVFPSIYNFSLPVAERMRVFEIALAKDCQLLFCDENLIVNTTKDLEIIKTYYDFYYK